MFKRKTIIWDIYYVILCLFLLVKIYKFFYYEGVLNLYYFIIRNFHNTLIWIYLINSFQLLLLIFHLYPLRLYIERKHIGDPRFWQVMFILKVISDIGGNSFEWVYLQSTYYDTPLTFLVIFIGSISTYIPMYMGCFAYAFLREQMIAADEKANHAKSDKA